MECVEVGGTQFNGDEGSEGRGGFGPASSGRGLYRVEAADEAVVAYSEMSSFPGSPDGTFVKGAV